MAGVGHNFPPGFRLSPNDYEAVYYYLMNKAYGREIEFFVIPEIDLYSFNPDQLPNDDHVWKVEKPAYFFTHNHQNNTGRIRWTSKGYWKAIGADKEIEHEGEVIGYKKNLAFHWDASADGTKANFIMAEYRLNPSLNTDDSNIRKNIENFLLCRVEVRAPDVIYVPRVRTLEEESESSDEEEIPSAKDKEVVK